MKNIKIKNLIYAFAFVLVFITTNSASAYVPGVWDPQPSVNPNPVFTNVVPVFTNVVANSANIVVTGKTPLPLGPLVTSPVTVS